ncbi:MAG: endo-1,4-beta-xylanase [Firmicutes bacterium]|nr:endo-1,4-beta-xylanase [Bacillota bacterium]
MKKRLSLLLLGVLIVSCLFFGSTGYTANICINPDFETGTTDGWYPYESCTIGVSAAQKHGGNYSALITSRTQTWHGLTQNMLDKLGVNKAYLFSGWVRLDNSASDTVKLTMKKIDNGTTTYDTITTATVTNTAWMKITGVYTIKGTNITTLEMYFEGPVAGVNFYVDDVSIEEVSTDWLNDANARIEQIRKRDAQIMVTNTSGQPMPGVSVQVKQTKNDFMFGCCLARAPMSNTQYLDFFKKYFEWAVCENEMKWYSNEPSQGNINYTDADYMYDWCVANGIKMRGHCIFWEVEQYVPSWVRNLTGSALQSAVDGRLNSVVPHFKGKVPEWDINNEMLHGNFFRSRLGDSIVKYMFERTKALDPACVCYVNDYNVIEYAETDAYVAQIQSYLDQGAPIGGIGCQGHYSSGVNVDPVVLKGRLDTLAQFNLPILITEFDSTNSDVNIRADNLEKLYRVAFSHPAVVGIYMWGFWAGSHWRGADAAIVNQDFTVNAAGKKYEALRAEWRTNTSGATNSSGVYSFRGFHGVYDVVLTSGGISVTKTIELKPGSGTATFTLSFGGSNPTPTPTQRGTVTATPTPTQPVTPTPTRRVTPTPTRRVTPTPTRRVTPTPTQRGITPTPVRRATPTPSTRPATPTPTSQPAGYMVAYVISSDWGTGATINVTITNNSATTVNGWTLAFTFPGNQVIANLWNGTYTQSGASVSVKDAGYNATIAANGGSVNFGFNVNYSGTNLKPASFTLNGTVCQIQ